MSEVISSRIWCVSCFSSVFNPPDSETVSRYLYSTVTQRFYIRYSLRTCRYSVTTLVLLLCSKCLEYVFTAPVLRIMITETQNIQTHPAGAGLKSGPRCFNMKTHTCACSHTCCYCRVKLAESHEELSGEPRNPGPTYLSSSASSNWPGTHSTTDIT